MKFIPDQEVDLEKIDHLGTKQYADTLVEIIRQSNFSEAFTIGLFGEWGSGKSSIVKTVESQINNDDTIHLFIYDAWKYSNDSFRRMFLLKLSESFGIKPSKNIERFYSNRTSDIEVDRKFDKLYISIIFITLFSSIWIINQYPEVSSTFSIAIAVNIIGIAIATIGRSTNDYKVTVQEPLMFAPEQFENCFSELIDVAIKGPNNILCNWFLDSLKFKKFKKVVIVIDNLDRCSAEITYELITTIKSFLTKHSGLFFIVPVDEKAVKAHISRKKGATEFEAEEFIRKFFNVSVRIRNFERFDMFSFANGVNMQYSLGFNPTTIDVISKAFPNNPRRVVQFFNDFNAELLLIHEIYDRELIEKHESFLCKINIIKLQWPTAYLLIEKDFSIMNSISNGYGDKQSFPEDFISFAKLTSAVDKFIPQNEMLSLLTNARRNKLPVELFDLLENGEVLKAITNHEEFQKYKSHLFEYFLTRVSRGAQRGLVQTELVVIYEMICELNFSYELDNYFIMQFEDEIRDHLKELLPFVNKYQLVVQNAELLRSRGFPLSFDSIVRFLDLTMNPEISSPYTKAARLLFSSLVSLVNDEQLLNKCKIWFENECSKSDFDIKDFMFSDNSEALIKVSGEKVVQKLIQNCDSVDENSICFKNIEFIVCSVNLSEADLLNLLDYFHRVINAKVKLTSDIDFKLYSRINLMLSKQDTLVTSESGVDRLRGAINAIFMKREHKGRLFRLYQTTLSEEDLSIVIGFFLSIYKISNSKLSINSYLSELHRYNTTIFNEVLFKNLIHYVESAEMDFCNFKELILPSTAQILTLTHLKLVIAIINNNSRNYSELYSEKEIFDFFQRLLTEFEQNNNQEIRFELLKYVKNKNEGKPNVKNHISKLFAI